MYLDPDMRSVPPRWEPPRKPKPGKRGEDAAVAIVLLIALGTFLAPVAGGTVVAMVMALSRLW